MPTLRRPLSRSDLIISVAAVLFAGADLAIVAVLVIRKAWGMMP